MGAIPFNSTQSNSVQSDTARHAGAEAHQFVVNLACPFILLSCPQNRGGGLCAAARTVGITHHLTAWG